MITMTRDDVMAAMSAVANRSPEDWLAIPVIQNSEGVDVLYDPELVHSMGFIVSMAAKRVYADGVRPVIILDDFVDSSNSMDFFIAHEEGHIVHGDLDIINPITNTLKRVLLQKLGLVQPIELNADAYAAEKVGYEKAIYALEWLYDNAPCAATRREVDKRIKALKKVQRA